MLRKFIRYILIAFGTVMLAVAAIITFFLIQGHRDSTTEVVGRLTLPKSGWVIEQKVTSSYSGGALATGSGMEIIARSVQGEQITLLTGPNIAVGMYSDEQGRPVISLPKPSNIYPIKIEHDSLRGIPVIYNFLPSTQPK